jgi:hypothetical protein
VSGGGRCTGCGSRATHVLVDEDGWTLRSCDLCWPLVRGAIEGMGGRVSDCECSVCRAYVAGFGGRRVGGRRPSRVGSSRVAASAGLPRPPV